MKSGTEEQLALFAVLNLALPGEQLAILKAAGDVDELALDYNDNCWIIPQITERADARLLRSLEKT